MFSSGAKQSDFDLSGLENDGNPGYLATRLAVANHLRVSNLKLDRLAVIEKVL
jgi:hypothetical protein